MKYWILPISDQRFRINDAIKAQDGQVDWRTEQFSVGDIVFVYKPGEKCIRFKMEVVQSHLKADQIQDQEIFWKDKSTYYSGLFSTYARLKLVEEYTGDTFSLAHMQEHGFVGIPISEKECKDKKLLAFLLNPSTEATNDSCEVDYTADDGRFYEGALVTVKANRYERNQKARQQCVDKKGYQCQVCGRDFEATYGEIGKNFIHVHHLTPISSIGKEYQLNVDTDLVPVCPNCHYMLHRKEPPYTIEELRQMMHAAEQHLEQHPTISIPEPAADPHIERIHEEYQPGCIPLYTLRAACGRFEDDELPVADRWVDATGHGFTPDKDRYFAVHAKGDSMLPLIHDGDICVFEWYTGGSRKGEIVLMQTSDIDPEFDGRYTIKRYDSEKIETEGTWEHKSITLSPLNPDYKDLHLDSDEDYRTFGIFVCVLK